MKCRVCKSNKITDLFYSTNIHGRHVINGKEKFIIAQCRACHAVFLRGLKIDQHYYDKYYELGYYNQISASKPSLVGKFLTLVTILSNLRKERLILRALGEKNGKVSILDIGCGNGGFLSSLNSSKFEKYGVEINREGYEICRKKGLSVYHGNIKDVEFKGKKFDAISLWHVLEHIEDPNQLFIIINNILAEEGVLIFQMPNIDSFGFKIGKKYWFHLDSPRHLILYGQKTVDKLCGLHNFEITAVINEFYEYPLDLFWSVRRSLIRFLFYPLYPLIKLFSRETLTYICTKK